MPWRESSVMSERLAFVRACLDRSERIVEICDRFAISEKTGQKWLKRFREEGPNGLADKSRARLVQPYRITREVAERVIALRRKYPLYGAAMLHDWLTQHEPEVHWPAASSIGELLKRANLIRPQRRHQSPDHKTLFSSRTRALEPNMVWTADFKGQFRLKRGSGAYCYPLTVLDLHTHYLLGCKALETTSVTPARHVFVRLFREYGLPTVLRTDNGIPFAHPNALGRLGALALWWVKLGIRPEHITPGASLYAFTSKLPGPASSDRLSRRLTRPTSQSEWPHQVEKSVALFIEQSRWRLRLTHGRRSRHLHHRLRLSRTRRSRFQYQPVYTQGPLDWLILKPHLNIKLSITRMIQLPSRLAHLCAGFSLTHQPGLTEDLASQIHASGISHRCSSKLNFSLASPDPRRQENERV